MDIYFNVILYLLEVLSERDKEIERLKRENRNCPSFDCGYCETFPTFHSVKCASDETKNCRWLDFDFTKTTYKEYMEKERIKAK